MTNHRNKQNYRFRTWKFRDRCHLKGGVRQGCFLSLILNYLIQYIHFHSLYIMSHYYAKFKENPCVGTDASTPLFFFQYQISFFKSITFQAHSRGTTGTRVLTENHKTYPRDFVCILLLTAFSHGPNTTTDGSLGNVLPLLCQMMSQLRNSLWRVNVISPAAQFIPQVLYWVEIWRIGWPVHSVNLIHCTKPLTMCPPCGLALSSWNTAPCPICLRNGSIIGLVTSATYRCEFKFPAMN